ncbi:S8 family serine peptidase [uncultured Piscinibacter sp.]|uniref:S8 family serine peptidase n=1 Tax=uncultured Piscinibacter sp. TaxID=1131835 RepID=UPI00260D39B3|nr:S8 family serine peptidase [uncultured Piscinibacter sp.]
MAPGWAVADGAAHGLIIKLRDASDGSAAPPGKLQRVLAEAGISARARGVGRRSQHLDFGRRLSAEEARSLGERLARQPEVEWVVPNERERRLTVPADPLFASSFSSSGQWWLFAAGGSNANDIEERRRGVPGVQSAWSTTTGSAVPVVAVLDTGITAHPDLGAGVLPGHDFVSTVEYANDGDGWDADASDPGDWVSDTDRSADPVLFGDCDVDDSSWHGTIIAGMLAAATDNGVGVAAANWNARVLPVRVAGKCGAEVADIIAGMRWAAGLQVLDGRGLPLPINPNRARVLNISFGGSAPCNAAYQETIDELAAAGVIIVAAAGNEHGAVARPANCRGVVGVASLNRDGFKSSYSSFGTQVALATAGGDPRQIGAWGMDLGDDALLTVSNAGTRRPGSGTYARAAGTSFAAPLVAGVAGLMLSVNPSLSARQLVDGLQRSARPHVVSPKIAQCSERNPGRCLCTTSTCGAGILDATGALQYAADPGGYVPPARQPEVIDNADVDAAVALGADRPANASVPPAASTGDSGGGALGASWLAALALAVAALSWRRGRSLGPVQAT